MRLVCLSITRVILLSRLSVTEWKCGWENIVFSLFFFFFFFWHANLQKLYKNLKMHFHGPFQITFRIQIYINHLYVCLFVSIIWLYSQLFGNSCCRQKMVCFSHDMALAHGKGTKSRRHRKVEMVTSGSGTQALSGRKGRPPSLRTRTYQNFGKPGQNWLRPSFRHIKQTNFGSEVDADMMYFVWNRGARTDTGLASECDGGRQKCM